MVGHDSRGYLQPHMSLAPAAARAPLPVRQRAAANGKQAAAPNEERPASERDMGGSGFWGGPRAAPGGSFFVLS